MSEWDLESVMAIVVDTSEMLFPDDIVKQAEHINKCYGSVRQMIDENHD